MTSLTRGSLPPEVYWRRRVIVIGSVLLLIFVLARLLGGGDGGSERHAAAPAVGTTTKNAAPSARRHRPGKSAESKQKQRHRHRVTPAPDTQGPAQGPSEPVLVEPQGACADKDVEVTPTVGSAVAGQPVTIQIRLRTVSTPACTWRMSSRHMALKITDGTDEVWSSQQCRFGIPISDVVVRQAVVTTVEMTWNARRSGPGCPHNPRWVLPGDFRVSTAALGGEPASEVFDLVKPPRPIVTLPPRHTPRHGSHEGRRHEGR